MDGILNVFKEAGWTSNDVVQKLRGILGTRKIGHGGTLDPAVTGVLPVAVGKATRLLEYMEVAGKSYSGTIRLGFSTKTEDAEGVVLERLAPPPSLSEIEIDKVLTTFVGQIWQQAPLYSAVKVKGKRLYDYARAGQNPERPWRQVVIKGFRRMGPLKFCVNHETASFEFQVDCSKGTYVRALAVDVAAKLGLPGHLSGLIRTMSNGLRVEYAKTLAEIEAARNRGQLDSLFLPLSVAVSDLTRVDLTLEQFEALRQGKRIIFENLAALDTPLAAFYGDELLGICLQGERQLIAKKILR